MPAIPRTYFDAPAANPMAGWSEERRRFFQQYGYDRGPGAMEQGATMMGEGNILQRKRGPETTVKVTETPPDDPTPTKRVTTTKYPEGEEPGFPDKTLQWGRDHLPSFLVPDAAQTTEEAMNQRNWSVGRMRDAANVTPGMQDTNYEMPFRPSRPHYPQMQQPSMAADYSGLLGSQAPGVQFDEYAPRRGEGGMADFDERGMQQYWQDAARREQRQPIGGTGVQYEGGSEDDNIRNIIRSAFREEDWETAERLIMEESSGDPNAINPEGEYSLGLLQVNWDVWGKGGEYEYLNERLKPILGRDLTQEDLFDPRINIHAAAAIKDRQGWDAWRLSMEKLAAKGYAPEAVTEEVVTEAPTGGMLADAYVDVGQGDFPGRLEEMNERGMAAYNAEAEARARRQQMAEPTPEQLFGPQETIAGAPETSRGDMNALFMAQMGQQVWHIDEETGEEITVQDIMDAQDENLALGPMAGSVRVSFNVLKAMDKAQRTRYFNYIKNFVRGKGKKADKKTKSLDEIVEENLERGRTAAAGTAGARTGAQTTAEAANAAKVAGRFKTAVPGVRTVGATAGLLGLGSQIEDKPWWLESFYNRAGQGLDWAEDFIKGRVVDPAVDLFEELKKTTVEKNESDAIEKAQETGSPSQRYQGLLESPAAQAAITPEKIEEDYEGILADKQTRMESGRTFAQELASNPDMLGIEEQKALDIKAAEVKRVAAQDAADAQKDLDRYYANFPEDVEGKRERYLKALKQIYKKVAILNVIASLTNSPSQAGAFMQLAAEKFKTLEGFRGEERLQKIARGVFFDENGVFDAPLSKQDAFNRAVRFGANHDEALALSGHQKDATPSKTETGVRIWYNTKTGQEVWMTKDQAPTGPDWLPKQAPTEKAGTEFERQRESAIELINAGNEPAALGDLKAWLVAKNSMMQMMPDQATIIAQFIIDSLKEGMAPLETEIDTRINQAVQAGVKSGKIDLGEI